MLSPAGSTRGLRSAGDALTDSVLDAAATAVAAAPRVVAVTFAEAAGAVAVCGADAEVDDLVGAGGVVEIGGIGNGNPLPCTTSG